MLLIESQLLHPMYPGQAPTVRRNPKACDLPRIPSQFSSSALLDLCLETEDGAKLARVFYYLMQNCNLLPTIRFIRGVSELVRQYDYCAHSLFIRQVMDLRRETGVGLISRAGAIRSTHREQGDQTRGRADHSMPWSVALRKSSKRGLARFAKYKTLFILPSAVVLLS